jgi:YggT family protein
MVSIAEILLIVINLYIWVLMAQVVMSWLVAFNVVNTRNRLVYTVADFLYRITEPALRPIRRYVPLIGGIDISPIILVLILVFLQRLIVNNLY